MILPNEFILGFIGGCGVTLGVTFIVAWSYSRVSGLPSPTGRTYQSEPLPFIVKDDRAEAAIERKYLDETPGSGR